MYHVGGGSLGSDAKAFDGAELPREGSGFVAIVPDPRKFLLETFTRRNDIREERAEVSTLPALPHAGFGDEVGRARQCGARDSIEPFVERDIHRVEERCDLGIGPIASRPWRWR